MEEQKQQVLTRRDFLKKISIGALGVAALLHFGPKMQVQAGVNDNTQDGQIFSNPVPPTDTELMWRNTGTSVNTYGKGGVAVPKGALCYYDGDGWKPNTATWY